MRSRIIPAALALTTLVPLACASFDGLDGGGRDTLGGSDGGGGADGAPEASPDAGAPRATKLYVFGGVTQRTGNEEPVLEARVASILADGSLGQWEFAPELDIVRSYMATVDVPGGPLVMAAGNGMDIGQPQSDFTFNRQDVGVAAGDPPAPWKAAPPLGSENGRWAAPGTFMAGRVYVAGGRVGLSKYVDTVMATTIDGAPPTVNSWKGVGTLPAAMADHGLVALGSRLYVLGGSVILGDGGVAVTASTWMTTLGVNDTLAPWVPAGSLRERREAFSVVTDDNRVFVIGGDDGSGGATNSVFIGSPNASAELEWQESTPLTVVRRHLCGVRANGRLYAIGGGDATVTPVVEVGTVNGTNIDWRETTPLPVAQSAMGCMAR